MKRILLNLHAIIQINQVFSLNKQQAHQVLSSHAHDRIKRANTGFFEEVSSGNFIRECYQEDCNSDELNEIIENLSSNEKPLTLKLLDNDKRIQHAAMLSKPIEITLTSKPLYEMFLNDQCKFNACNELGTKSCVNGLKSFKCNCLDTFSGTLCDNSLEHIVGPNETCYEIEGKSRVPTRGMNMIANL